MQFGLFAAGSRQSDIPGRSLLGEQAEKVRIAPSMRSIFPDTLNAAGLGCLGNALPCSNADGLSADVLRSIVANSALRDADGPWKLKSCLQR
jgi:hypothetical protein